MKYFFLNLKNLFYMVNWILNGNDPEKSIGQLDGPNIHINP
ncbi:MAG: hypothetical protein CM15mP81_18820 [Alphaproteobacteria bacterium]|nr:MAG: hypothetical protein CM15mP81_18820 [Alphaproteobacteria bacterium]